MLAVLTYNLVDGMQAVLGKFSNMALRQNNMYKALQTDDIVSKILLVAGLRDCLPGPDTLAHHAHFCQGILHKNCHRRSQIASTSGTCFHPLFDKLTGLDDNTNCMHEKGACTHEQHDHHYPKAYHHENQTHLLHDCGQLL